jgi:hypothetical protein
MKSLSFKKFIEGTDIFGFERKIREEPPDDSMLMRPIDQFDIELMIDFLSKKKLGKLEIHRPFPNVIQWGSQPGALKLEVDPGYRFQLKKLAADKQGHPRWLTKKLFQLNRCGYGGYEDAVAQEVFEHIQSTSKTNIESPVEDYRDLEKLVENIYNKLKRTAKVIFFPEGIKKLNDDAYILKFGMRGQGLETRDHNRVEQFQIMATYDKDAGTIRICDYKIESPTGRGHSWTIKPSDLDFYALPTQDRDEISEIVAVHLKYY